MRVLLAIPYYWPAHAFGGSVTVAQTVTEELVAAGHEVTVVTTDVLDENRRIALDAAGPEPRIAVVRFRNASHRLAARAMGFLPLRMNRWLRENTARYDVVLLHDFYSMVSVRAARAASAAGVPYVLQPLGTISTAPERGRSQVKRAWMRAWGRRSIEEAAALFPCSSEERRVCHELGAREEQLVDMPLPLDLPSPSGVPKHEHPTVAYMGRLHPIKRIGALVEAIAIARRTIPDLRLEAYGPGDAEQRRLESLARTLGIADAVRFHGYIDVSEKSPSLERAHVSALLSASEGLPMGPLEAMACGTPVVLSRGCQLPEVHERAGLVVPGEPGDAAAAIVRLLGDEALRTRLGEGARAFARGYRREVVMPRMIAALAEIAGR